MTARRKPLQPGLRWLGVNALMVLAVAISSVTVVVTSHQCRQAYTRLQSLQLAQWDMQENWSRLLLQESALATHYRVEQAAERRLQMRIPDTADTRWVRR